VETSINEWTLPHAWIYSKILFGDRSALYTTVARGRLWEEEGKVVEVVFGDREG